ncbi:hypothetical protein D3227_21215 [Mesorhizobium waimense]|uniref:Uncharacterized protein n=1 Tax=Mesorhizobium waimense TaxID=1300307 RepID=A0A3A5KKG4_9HYPH|nr:hypothetical protein [Mesorhizobium waimense]RJT36221.1 hypothetical protein D3227_21215 [Mesorhizobium waimense]
MIAFRPDNIDVMVAVRLVRFARNALLAATLKLDDAGYACAALDDLYADCAGLVADWAGRKPKSVPDHIVRAAVEYRRQHGRSY